VDEPSGSPSILYTPRLPRRDFLRRAGQVGLTLPLGAALAACSKSSTSSPPSSSPTSSSPEPVTGKAVILNYAGWMGKHNVDHFEAANPGASIKQITEGSISSGAVVAQIKARPSLYDGSLGDLAVVGQAIAADVLQPLDWSKIPNIKYVDETFRKAYSHAVPSDYGKVGIGYRADLVQEDITSWADVWRLAPKYSGKVVFIDLDRDCIGSALKLLGFSTNTTSTSELDQALQKLLSIKPHLQAILGYNIGTGLAKGTTYIAMDWDYDVALAQQSNANIKWVLPNEGATAYLEGFFAIKGTTHLPVFESFFDLFLEPKEYADFVNTTGTAYVEQAATPYVNKTISGNNALVVDPTSLAHVEFEEYVGPAIAEYTKVWDQFKSA
jgi:spermidine/putrescine transport system substrate-binding protein